MIRFILAGAAVLAAAVPAGATVVDFEGLPLGNNPNPLVLSGASFSVPTGFNYIVSVTTLGLCTSVRSSDPADCSRDLHVGFAGSASNISFTFLGNNDTTVGDNIGNVAIFNGAMLLGNVGVLVIDTDIFSPDLVSLTGFSNVTNIVVSSTDFGGVVYDDFVFNPAISTPEPAALALFGLGAATLIAGRRRRG